MTIEILPPRSPGREVTIDGYLVPNVEVGERDGKWSVFLDGRFGIDGCTFDELQRWLWLLANAQAIGGGYSCHGENSQRMNPHKVRCMEIGAPPTTPTLRIVKDDERP
jgi:hypothetical protein